MIFESLLLKSFFVGIFLSALYGLTGAIVINKKMSFFADGIAHAVLAGIAIGILLNLSPFFFALLTAILFSFVIRSISRIAKIHYDTMIGIIFTFGFALGLILLLALPQYRGNLLEYLLGDILAISNFDFLSVIFLFFFLVFLFLKFKRYLVLWLVDEVYLALQGESSRIFEIVFYIILSILIVLGLKLAGIILVSALLIIPPATAKFVSKSFHSYIIWTLIFSVIGFVLGFLISYHFNLPTGPSIVLVDAFIFFLVFLIFSGFLYNIQRKK